MRRFLSNLVRDFRSTDAARSARRAPRRASLQVESLEDRRVPATLLVNTLLDQAASTPFVLTLREAIGRANQTPGDTIVLAGGTYKLSLGQLTITSAMTIEGQGAGLTTVDGGSASRIFNVAGSGSLTLQNLTLQNGLAQGIGTAAEGGAIFTSGTLNLTNVTVQNNVAQGSNGVDAALALGAGGNGESAFGGALYMAGGSVSLTNDTLSSNRAYGGIGGNGLVNTNPGGGNFISGPGGAGGNGGAADGGGIYLAEGNLSLSNDTFSGNGAFGGSGGKGGEGAAGGKGGDGAGGEGGALDVALAGTVTSSNDTFSNNLAIGGLGGPGGRGGYDDPGPGGAGGSGGASVGGGLHLGLGTATLTNDTLSGNEAVGGTGGAGGQGDADSGSLGGAGGLGGESVGGGLMVEFAGSNATLSGDTLSGNLVFGGDGGVGGNGAGADDGGAGGNGGSGGNGGGGGLYVGEGSITLTNDTLSGNRVYAGNGNVAGNGGAAEIPWYGGSPTEGDGGNGGAGGAGAGGGLDVTGGSVTLGNDTLSGNFAAGGVGGGGGAAGGITGSSILPFKFISQSPPGNGGNGGNALGGGVCVSGNANVSLANTLIAENTLAAGPGGVAGPANKGATGANGSPGTASGPDVSGNVVSSDHDLIGNTSGSSGFGNGNGTVNHALFLNRGGGSGLQWGNGDILNPPVIELGPLAHNGGPTQTLALLPGSPALGAGDKNAPGLPATDQRGFARVVANALDIGAYESGATPPTAHLTASGNAHFSGAAGGTITYTLTVRNISAVAQRNVTVADPLPPNVTLVSWSAAAGWASSAPPAGSSGGTVTAWIGSLAGHSSATFTLVVRVPAAPIRNSVITNTFSLAPFATASAPGTNSIRFSTPVLFGPTTKVEAGGNLLVVR